MKHRYRCTRLIPNGELAPYIIEAEDEASAKQQMQKLFPDDVDFKVLLFSQWGSTSSVHGIR